MLCFLWRRWRSGRRVVCCWAGLLGVPVGGGPPASRPRREPSARRVVSKPGQAPPPPTGTAVRPTGPSGALHAGGAFGAVWCRPGPATAHGHRSQAHGSLRRPPRRWRLRCCVVPSRPRRRPRAPQPGPPVPPTPLHIGGDWHAGVCLGALSRSPPVPSGPSGALHTCGAWSLCVPVGGDPPVSRPRRELRSARRLVVRPGPAAHRHRGVTRCPQVSCPALACRIAEPTLNFARNSLAALSNHELRSLELQRFQTLLNVHTIELRAVFVGGAAVTDECCGQVLGLPADRYRGLVPPL